MPKRTLEVSANRKRSRASSKPLQPTTRLFVIDTNVLMHDPSSLFHFEEHDIFLPMIVLEELDNHKKGMTEVARNARQASRFLDDLLTHCQADINEGVALDVLHKNNAKGRLYLQTQAISVPLPSSLPAGKADNQILTVLMYLQQLQPSRQVILVSKDINMRIKARALGLLAEDYFNDQVIDDTDLLYNGMYALPNDFWESATSEIESWQQNGHTYYRITSPLCANWLINQCIFQDSDKPFLARVIAIQDHTATLETLKDYSHQKNNVWGITARNREQNIALNLLMNPDVDFVTLLGQAGTGKTLLTLAAALEQTINKKLFSEIIMTRVTVPVGEDIGFLPGTEEEKMAPWMGALEDNLEVLNRTDAGSTDHEKATVETARNITRALIQSHIRVKSLNFMRGRTFLNKLLIIDEAQNLTPKQMRTLITRAGPGTKVVCLGNLAQIDTPYLTEGSSGLTYVVDRFKGWLHNGHITLQRGERSRLADHAAEVL